MKVNLTGWSKSLEVTADLACAIADGGEVISGFRVLAGQKELFGLVASVPATWRTLDEIAAGGPRALARITRAVNGGRRQAWAAIEGRPRRPARRADRRRRLMVTADGPGPATG